MKHSHYKKDVSGLTMIDVYRVCDLFGVQDTSGATQHAIKKLLLPGQRGGKSMRQDLQEAVDSLNRRIQMLDEDAKGSLEQQERLYSLKCNGCAKGCLACRKPEPAAEIDDSSERMQAIGQNGNDGAAYLAGNIERHPETPRHHCGACGLNHALHQCTGGQEGS